MPDISKLLWPKSVAVVGASNDLRGLRGRILETILAHPYEGKVFPVSRSADEVQGLKAYKSVDDLPEPVDLAILIIPAQFVPASWSAAARPASRPPSFSPPVSPRSRAAPARACRRTSPRSPGATTWR